MICVLASLLVSPTLAGTDDSIKSDFQFKAFYTEKDYIEYYADKYGANKHQLLTVAYCESGYKQYAVGDGGRAIGIFQYHEPTFNSYSRLLGEELDYYSAHDQAKLTAFIWTEYPNEKRAWTCATKNGFA